MEQRQQRHGCDIVDKVLGDKEIMASCTCGSRKLCQDMSKAMNICCGRKLPPLVPASN
jgi:hypothetical protein